MNKAILLMQLDAALELLYQAEDNFALDGEHNEEVDGALEILDVLHAEVVSWEVD